MVRTFCIHWRVWVWKDLLRQRIYNRGAGFLGAFVNRRRYNQGLQMIGPLLINSERPWSVSYIYATTWIRFRGQGCVSHSAVCYHSYFAIAFGHLLHAFLAPSRNSWLIQFSTWSWSREMDASPHGVRLQRPSRIAGQKYVNPARLPVSARPRDVGFRRSLPESSFNHLLAHWV